MTPNRLTQRPSFRRISTCLLGTATLALVTLSPAAHVSAADGNGALVFGARLCPTVLASDNFVYECTAIDPGAVTFVSWDGATTLGMDSAVNVKGILNWHAPNVPVPLTDYHIDVTGLTVPDGYELWNIVPGMGEGGGSEFGWYASLTEESPETDLYALYVPDGGPDSDGDGAPDSAEIAFGSDPYDASSFPAVQAGPDPGDADGDGASDAAEAAFGSDPYDASSFPAVQAGPDPGDAIDADGDAVSDLDEINIYGTDPNAADTDGDGASDYDEIWAGVDPLDPAIFPAMQAGPDPGMEDADADSLTDLEEINSYGTDPNAADSDGDGAPDFDEVYGGTDPLDPSSFPSVQAGPDSGPSAGPSDADDSDGDGVGDLTETIAGTDPYNACSFPDLDPLHGPSAGPSDCDDTDGDGAGDGTEANAGTDSNDPTSFPAVQAGPEPAKTTGAPGNAAPTVMRLPSTGSGAPNASTPSGTSLVLTFSAAMAALGGFVGIRRRA